MSSNEEQKPNDVTDDAHEASPAHSASSKQSGGGALIFLFFIIGLALSMVVGWAVFPEVLYEKENQPFDFNHKMHLEQVDNGCESCHFFRKDGTFAGVPRLAQCTGCHSEVLGESKDEEVFVEQYVDQGREVPWRVYARQPDCVFFPHAAHIYGAKLDCTTCHGNIGTSEHLKTYEVNRISGYSRDIWGRNISGIKHHTWDRMKMDDCAECHQESADIHDSSVQTGRDACFVCHK
jgi:menaquinone reductase, multiheme cytochrome c subunit